VALNKNITETRIVRYLKSLCKNLMKSRITILVKEVALPKVAYKPT
jgi:hypothetical protein